MKELKRMRDLYTAGAVIAAGLFIGIAVAWAVEISEARKDRTESR